MVLLEEALQQEGEPQSIEHLKALVDRDSREMRSELLHSAVFVPQQPYFRSFWQSAAAFFRSLVKNHAFFDGNKRTALIALGLFLNLNGWDIAASQRQLVKFTIGVARGSQLWTIESWLRRHHYPVPVSGHRDTMSFFNRLGAIVDRLGVRRPLE
ncbi:MAG: type II toxin-antitoxin system death-on-curing family toxin [Firmicutes bacterium]|nr:type II toxin-antitoxin system death-on-curing family toxin [Bacillota bacterium]